MWEEPERRRIGMVFQDGALFPHLTVASNVGFGDADAGRVEECLALVGLADRSRSYPHELSGGERQRVALARALAPEPEVVLLDEPFASLDAGLRVSLREEVARSSATPGASALLVTHDQQEALSLADVVIVMRDGRVEQTGTPEDVYSHPSSRWVAEFLGEAEVLAGTAADGVVDCELGAFPPSATSIGAVEVVVRPEPLALAADASAVPRARTVTSPAASSAGRTTATTRWSSSSCRAGAESAAGAAAANGGRSTTRPRSGERAGDDVTRSTDEALD